MSMTTTKSRPIIMSVESVRAILDGRKTHTRRVVKPQPIDTADLGDEEYDGPQQFFVQNSQLRTPLRWGSELVPCPHGAPDDELWVRETWVHSEMPDGRKAVVYRAGCDEHDCFNYASEDGTIQCLRVGPWKSPMFMPRWASRLTLRITGVRVERVQSITEDDAAAEGCDGNCAIGYVPAYKAGPLSYHFAQRWDELNAKRGFPWADNPWVWVIEFEWIE